MKGIVMNLLAEMVETQLGIDEWNQVLDAADESGIFTATAIYEDARLLQLVSILSERNHIAVDDLVFSFGQFMFPAFYARYPNLIDHHDNMLDFLESLDSVIHVEVVKLYPDHHRGVCCDFAPVASGKAKGSRISDRGSTASAKRDY